MCLCMSVCVCVCECESVCVNMCVYCVCMCVCVCVCVQKKVLSLGNFPERLKYSIVKLMFKKRDRSVISRSKPISLLPSFSTIFEKLIYATL